jgi:hypothetical protein
VTKFKASSQLEFAEGGKGDPYQWDSDAPTGNKRKLAHSAAYYRILGYSNKTLHRDLQVSF